MLLLVTSALAVLSVIPAGGRLSRLAGVRLRVLWLPAALLAVQVLIISIIPHAWHPALAVVHVMTYVGAGGFVLANRHIPGVSLLAAGAVTNGVTIAANGGTLPARPEAIASAGLDHDPGSFNNSIAIANPRLSWLGDIFSWPAPLPLHNTFSVGDVLVLLGVLWGAHVICRTRLVRGRGVTTASAGARIALSRLAAMQTQRASLVLPNSGHRVRRLPRTSAASGTPSISRT